MLKPNKPSKFIILAVLASTTMSLFYGVSALALPGQSISKVLEWSKKHSMITPLQKNRKLEDQEEADYQSSINMNGAIIYVPNEQLSFSVWTDSRTRKVDMENIYYSNPKGVPSLDFYTGGGFRLIEAIYDRSIMDDFIKAKLIKTRKIGNIPIRFASSNLKCIT